MWASAHCRRCMGAKLFCRQCARKRASTLAPARAGKVMRINKPIYACRCPLLWRFVRRADRSAGVAKRHLEVGGPTGRWAARLGRRGRLSLPGGPNGERCYVPGAAASGGAGWLSFWVQRHRAGWWQPPHSSPLLRLYVRLCLHRHLNGCTLHLRRGQAAHPTCAE